MKTQSKHERFLQLDSICKDYSNYNAKIASLTQQNSRYSHSSEAFLLIIEYLQIMSQALLINPELYDNLGTTETRIPEGVIFCAKILNPGFWLLLEDYKILTLIILACFILLTTLKPVIGFLIFRHVYKDIQAPKWLSYLWRTMHRAQGRVIYYFLTSLWVKLISMSRQGKFPVLEIDTNIIIAVGSVMIAFEYVFSLAFQIRYCYILPTKNLLCSKDNDLVIITLTQKLIIQILQMALSLDTSGIIWVFTTLNLLFSLLRQRFFFANLPFYNFKALQYQERLLAIVISLDIACFMQNMLDSLDYYSDIKFIIVTWILLAILIGKVSREYLNKIHLNFNSQNKAESCKFAIHRIRALKYLRSLKLQPLETVDRYELSYMLNNSVSVNTRNILNVPMDDDELNMYSKQSSNKMFRHYLESLRLRFPKDEFLKLYLTYFYAIKLRLYGIAMKSVIELQDSSSSKVSLSASLLIYDIQKSIQRDYKDSSLNLHTFIKNQAKNAEIKAKLSGLISKQTDLYNEILKESPDLENLFQWAQNISQRKQDIEKNMKLFLEAIPDNNIRPYLIYSLYHFTLSHSIVDSLDYQRKYNLRSTKYSRVFKGDKLVKENLYQDTNIFLILSGQSTDRGKILYCPKSIQDAYGGEVNLYLGANISTLAPPCLRGFYEQFHQMFAEVGAASNFGTPTRNFLYHKDGYIVETDFYMNVHPHLTRGLLLDVILRPVPTIKDCIILNEGGYIEGMTREVAKKLGLRHYEPQTIHIKSLSEELWEISEAFSLVHASQKVNLENKNEQESFQTQASRYFIGEKRTMKTLNLQSGKSYNSTDLEMKLTMAQEIYGQYIKGGNEIEIASLSNKIYSYRCQVANKTFGSQLLKFVMLEEMNRENRAADSPKKVKQYFGKGLRTKTEEEFKTQSYQDTIEKEIKLDDSDDLQLADEKQGGWINLKSLDAEEDIARTKPFETLEEPLNFPLSPTETQITVTRGLISSPANKILPSKSLKQTFKSQKAFNERMELNREQQARFIEVNKSMGSQRSKSSQEKRISNAFKLAIGVNYTSNTLRLISLTYYGLLIAIFATQLSIKTTIDQTISTLGVGKDFVSSVEDRSFYLANIMFLTRLASDTANGRINVTGFSPVIFAEYLLQFSQNLSSVNKQLLTNISLIDTGREQGATFFNDDVRVYSFDVAQSERNFTTLSNFQAVDRIVETGFKVANAFKTGTSDQVEDQILFLLRNTVNDIYLWNDMLSSAADSFVETERQSINDTVTIYIICTVLIGTLTNLILTIFIIRVYFKEKSHMSAVATLNNNGVRKALDQVNYFKKILELEVIIENQDNIASMELLKNDHETNLTPKLKNQKGHLKVSNYKGLRRKYIFRLARIWLIGFSIAGLTVGNCVLGTTSLQSFQSIQSQLSFASRLRTHATLVGVVSQELLAGNGTTLIENKLSSEIIGDIISSLNIMKNQISSVFMTSDFTYDPSIQDILFNDGCDILEESQWKSLCMAHQASGKKAGLLYLVGELDNLAEDKKIQFENSNKSQEELDSIWLQDFQTLTEDYFITAEQCATISRILNQKFKSQFTSSGNQRAVVFAVYTLLLAWFGLVVWMLILRRLMNAVSQVKAVLQAFPATLVLSSFILRTFLVKTSKGALDIVKNHM